MESYRTIIPCLQEVFIKIHYLYQVTSLMTEQKITFFTEMRVQKILYKIFLYRHEWTEFSILLKK